MLAGVNGAGKSSILGRHLQDHRHLAWFNPDAFARELQRRIPLTQSEANAWAWQEGVDRLDRAIRMGISYAFETTLGGNTLTERLARATASHDVFLWYCGLATPEQHIARVRARAAIGGHHIPEQDIRRRLVRSPTNLIRLMPMLSHLRVYDNSEEAGTDGVIPDPKLLLEMSGGRLVYPNLGEFHQLARIPEWARPLVAAAVRR